jgi:hypothetical protein
MDPNSESFLYPRPHQSLSIVSFMSSPSPSEGDTPNSSPARDSDDLVSVDSKTSTENFFDTLIPECAPSGPDAAHEFPVESNERESNPQLDLTLSVGSFVAPQQSVAPCQNCGHLSSGSSGGFTFVHSPAVSTPTQQARRKPKKTKTVAGKQKEQKKRRCPFCGKPYVRTDNLAGHIAGVHLGVRFQCPVKDCPVSSTKYRLAASLLKHLDRHHKEVKSCLSSVGGIPAHFLPECASNLGALKEAFQIAGKLEFVWM